MNKNDENKREVFRILLPIEMCGSITVYKVRENIVKKGKINICILDLSATGLRFKTKLNLPVENVVYKITFEINKIKYDMESELRWKKEGNNGKYTYGVRFLISNDKVEKFIPIVNKLAISCKGLQEECYSICSNIKKCPNNKSV